MREDIYEGILSNDIVSFHTRSYRRNFLLCCRELFDLEVDEEAGIVHFDGREVWVRAYPLPISAETFQRNAQRPEVHEYEREILRRRREHLILRVDRADLSKNVLRGFTAFDLFLEQHPEFLEQVTFIAHLIPSRQDVPEYAEYLERIEALVAVVNHRHGTTDWMPIELRLRENLEEAIAAYKHYDLLMVNAMFDGMNLIAKEGPLVNERNGVSLLSENTGAHEELADFALSVNPFDVQEQADAIHRALTMSARERSWRAQGLKRIVTARDPGDWVDDQLADIEREAQRQVSSYSVAVMEYSAQQPYVQPAERGITTARLLGQVMFLVSVAVGFLALGIYMGRNLAVGTATICSFVGLGMLLVASFAPGRLFRVGPFAVVWLYALAVVLGLGLGPIIQEYLSTQPQVVYQAAGMTGLVTLGMGAAGFAWDRDLARWMRPLSFIVLGLVVVSFVTAAGRERREPDHLGADRPRLGGADPGRLQLPA